MWGWGQLKCRRDSHWQGWVLNPGEETRALKEKLQEEETQGAAEWTLAELTQDGTKEAGRGPSKGKGSSQKPSAHGGAFPGRHQGSSRGKGAPLCPPDRVYCGHAPADTTTRGRSGAFSLIGLSSFDEVSTLTRTLSGKPQIPLKGLQRKMSFIVKEEFCQERNDSDPNWNPLHCLIFPDKEHGPSNIITCACRCQFTGVKNTELAWKY